MSPKIEAKSPLGLTGLTSAEYYHLFIQSRMSENVTAGTLYFYQIKLLKFFQTLNPDSAKSSDIEKFLFQFENAGNRHAYYRAIRTFFKWREDIYGLLSPMKHIKAPKLPKLLLPTLNQDMVMKLISGAESLRDKAIIALFPESGLRLSELVNIKLCDIDWENRQIRIIGKGRKEAYAPFGALSEKYLKAYLSTITASTDGNVWNINQWGIVSMLRRLEAKTGIKANPHVFRRTFATLLRKMGVDSLTIKDLGRWESVEIVQRYTRAFSFQDALAKYKSPLQELT